jgi:hypothetical protein
MVVDCTNLLPTSFHHDGLTLETGMSMGFAGDHPTAYIVSNDRPIPMRLPGPAILKVAQRAARSLYEAVPKVPEGCLGGFCHLWHPAGLGI